MTTLALLPGAAMLAGATVASFRGAAPRVRSYLQHFAAGVVFSAAALDVVPEIVHRSAPVAVVVGFSTGTAVMLVLRFWAGGSEVHDRTRGLAPRTVAVVGIDVLVDGLLIGLLLTASGRGSLVAVALAIELLALGLALGASGAAGRRRTLATVAALSALPWIGSVAGSLIASGVSHAALDGLLAFALAALLYLATEELLVEAHEVPETTLATATFFLGFLLLLLLDLAAAG